MGGRKKSSPFLFVGMEKRRAGINLKGRLSLPSSFRDFVLLLVVVDVVG